MMKAFRRYLIVGLLVLLVLLLIVVLSASSWLETTTGRNLLERELSRALSMEAALQGDYSLQLFPAIQIVGNELLLSDAKTGHMLAKIYAYELQLALKPLFRKQIDILKIAINDGSLNLDGLTEMAAASAAGTGESLQLPNIRKLEISGLMLQKSADDFLLISQMSLTDFAESKKSQLALALALPMADGESKLFDLDGYLQVFASPFQVLVDVQALSVNVAGQSWPVGEGTLSWLATKDEFTGDLRGLLAGYSSAYQFSVHTAEALWLELNVELRSADNGVISVRLDARDSHARWLLEPIELNLDGQELLGSGCLSLAGEPLLQLQLQAIQLDLDVLQEMVPAGLLPNGKGIEAGEISRESSGELDLPIELAIALSAEQLRMSGAIAQNVHLLVGDEPDCTLALSESSN